MAFAALLLAAVTTSIDSRIDSDWPEQLPLVYASQPDGARALLSTVAGSMITVTGITFSLTLLAVSHATSQFGPRLLTNFMRDRGNQFTLGTFIATFLYCLMILRTVRSRDEAAAAGEPSNDALGAFVPHVSILIAILLTIASVGVLIYFIHHIPESIRLSNVVANVGRELIDTIPSLFPEAIAEDRPASRVNDARLELPEHFEELATRIHSEDDGYIQTVDEDGLFDFAVKNDLVVQMCAVPGDFVSSGQPLLLVEATPDDIAEEVRGQLRFMFALGAHRTSTQNALFLVDQLVEVASRALSPGVNDPMTAMTCIDWLQSALVRLSNRTEPESFRFDGANQLRVVAAGATFGDFCSRVFDQLRPYAAPDRNAALHLMRMIAHVVGQTSDERYHQILATHAKNLFEASESAGLLSSDRQRLRSLCDACLTFRNG